MVKIVPVEEALQRFKDILPKIPERYKRMVSVAVWKAPAIEAEDFWVEAVRAAADAKARSKGIEPWDDASWQSITILKGAPVIRTRIEQMLPKYQLNWTPYRDAIEKLVLPAKVVDWETNIANRVVGIVRELKRLKGILKKGIYVPKPASPTA